MLIETCCYIESLLFITSSMIRLLFLYLKGYIISWDKHIWISKQHNPFQRKATYDGITNSSKFLNTKVRKSTVIPILNYIYSIITLNRDCVGISAVQRDAKRFTTWASNSISKECSSNLPNSTGLSLIAFRNIFITFYFGRSTICSRASTLPLISKLSKSIVKFVDDH